MYDITTARFVDSGVDASITVDIADITMLPTTSNPNVTNTGTNTDPIFHLFIPSAKSIASLAKTGTSGLVDTYTVTFTDNTTTTFAVTNGSSIDMVSKTGSSGLVDTYTITLDNGETHTFSVTNGTGISDITKTATAGLVDTYVITLNDGTTSSFTVTNGAKGDKGDTGNGIASVSKTGTSGLVDTYTITYTDSTTATFAVTNGEKGDKGDTGDKGDKGDTGEKGDKGDTGDKGEKGDTGETGAQGEPGSSITSITKTSTSGLVDTYTVATSDGGTYTFTVTNGRDGTGSGDMSKDVYDADNAVADAGGITGYVSNVVDGLDTGVSSFNGRTGAVTPATGDYTAAMVGARADTWTPTAADVGLGNVDNTSDLDKPVSTATQAALNAKEATANKVTSISSSSTDTQYPSAKAVYDLFNSIVNANNTSY